jgi:hypothetical protein
MVGLETCIAVKNSDRHLLAEKNHSPTSSSFANRRSVSIPTIRLEYCDPRLPCRPWPRSPAIYPNFVHNSSQNTSKFTSRFQQYVSETPAASEASNSRPRTSVITSPIWSLVLHFCNCSRSCLSSRLLVCQGGILARPRLNVDDDGDDDDDDCEEEGVFRFSLVLVNTVPEALSPVAATGLDTSDESMSGPFFSRKKSMQCDQICWLIDCPT